MIKNIIFDFDGVIIDSLPIKEFGFREIFKKYNINLVDKLIAYHDLNGGLSRFVKIRYFYNQLLGLQIDEKIVTRYSDEFSVLMKSRLCFKNILIKESVDFIKSHYKKISMSIASGTEEKELQYISEKLELDSYFNSICGSPKTKNDVVLELLNKYNYKKEETILIGDSINDYDAANINGIRFFGYNNTKLKDISCYYINDFIEFEKEFFDEDR